MVTKLFFATAMLISSISAYSREEVNISGSSTIYPISEKLIKTYSNQKLKITNTASSSSKGLIELLSSQTDIAGMSRGLSKKELFKIKQSDKNLRPFKIGFDAICIISSPSITEKINKISKKELREIFFSRRIKKWEQVSAKLKGNIKAFAPKKSSGTSKVFLEFMEQSNYSNNVQLLKKSSDLVKTIENTPNSIGIASYGIISHSDINPMDYSSDGKEYHKCSVKMVRERKYDLVRGLFYVVEYPPKESVARFLDFVLETQGQGVIQNFGMVPVR